MEEKLEDTKNRYTKSFNEVQSYISYIERFFLSSILNDDDANAMSQTLVKDSSISSIQKNYSLIEQEIKYYIKQKQTEYDTIGIDIITDNITNSDAPTPDGDIVLFLCQKIRDGKREKQTLIKEAKSIAETLSIIKGDLIDGERFCAINDSPELIEHLVDSALAEEDLYLKNKTLAKIDYAEDSLNAVRLFDLNNPMNIYRQSFIQIMTFFDSTVFEVAEICMSHNFFTWLKHFDNINIKTHDLAAQGSFERFQTTQIRQFLKNCYVKDLVTIFHQIDPNLFLYDGEDSFKTIREMINRRNAHIHNNGVADNTYIEEFNIFGANIGDFLVIDRKYLTDVGNITNKFIRNIELTEPEE